MLLWTSLLSLLLSMTIFAFNLLLLMGIVSNSKLHSISNVLSCNLWLSNCITAVVGVFHSLFLNLNTGSHVHSAKYLELGTGNGTFIALPTNSGEHHQVGAEMDYMTSLGPQTLAALFNSTVSLLALMAMAFVQIFAQYQTWLPRSAPFRISLCIWTVVVGVLVANFALVQVTQSFALIVAFQLALLSIFLVFNLILHPINLWLTSRTNQANIDDCGSQNYIGKQIQDLQLSRAITQALWLLMHSLSFTLLAMMLVWESSPTTSSGDLPSDKNDGEENVQLISLQLAAYTVHCIANPMIAVLREGRLASTIGKLLYRNNPVFTSTHYTDSRGSSTSSAGQEVMRWFLPEMSWIMNNIPPPPPYRSPSYSISSEIDSNNNATAENEGIVYGEQEASQVMLIQRPVDWGRRELGQEVDHNSTQIFLSEERSDIAGFCGRKYHTRLSINSADLELTPDNIFAKD